MHGAGLLAFVILVGVTTSACQQGVGLPAPPPPDLTGRVLPKPPGRDDFAHRSFGHPLSLQDAEAVLRHTRVFEVGGMPPKRQVQAFNVVFEQADAVGRFRSIAEGESPAGKLYGFAALLLLDPAAAKPLRVSLSVDERRILVIESDTSDEKPVRDLARMVEQRDMGGWFRRVRDETTEYFEAGPSQASSPTSPECPTEAPLEPGLHARDRAIAAVRRSLRTGPEEWRTYEIQSAYPATSGKGFSIVAFPMCGPVVGSRTWVVEIRFPKLEPSASLSQGQAFVSRFRSGWRVWYRYH